MSMALRIAAKGAQQKRNVTQPKSMPAPVAGWTSAQNLGAMQPGTAIVLNNWFPTTTGIRVRGGSQKHATVGALPVESLMAYVGPSRQLFASADGDIYSITTVADPDVPPAPDVTGQSSNYYSHANFATTGGFFMYAVNGTDDALLYDGTTWTPINGASVPAITGTPTSGFAHVNVYRNRLYFVEAGSMNIWYLPVDSIGGSAAVLSLNGIFAKGGSALFTATWSSESGANAMQAYLVVWSTEGEAAVFTGSFPGATDWSLVNTYDISKPLGKNGWFRAGGDVVVATEMGLVPVSAARFKDPAALGMDAISKNIEPDWKRLALERGGIPWEIAKWDRQNAYYVNTPITSSEQPLKTIVGNLTTGAPCQYTGWDTRTLVIHNSQMYFGTNEGTVYLAEVGGSDDGMPYVSEVAFAWDHLGVPAYIKTVQQAKADFTTTLPFVAQISDSVNYNQAFPTPPSAPADIVASSVFDTGQFDIAVFDAGAAFYRITTYWRSIGRTGETHAMQVQITNNNVNTPSVEMIALHILFDTGEIAVD